MHAAFGVSVDCAIRSSVAFPSQSIREYTFIATIIRLDSTISLAA